MTTAVMWFTHDLRLSDNPALVQANEWADQLICCCFLDNEATRDGYLSIPGLGPHRHRFLLESLHDLNQQLAKYGQSLLLLDVSPEQALPELIDEYRVDAVFASEPIGHEERARWQRLSRQFPDLRWRMADAHGLYRADQWPFDPMDYPSTFSRFRRRVEGKLDVNAPVPAPERLAPPPADLTNQSMERLQSNDTRHSMFQGGRASGWQQIQSYFATEAPRRYKTVRNALDGWDTSSKWSPWLAAGCLSVREIMQRLTDYEAEWGANHSTYWLYFELLWREYYLGAARVFGNRLFLKGGIAGCSPEAEHHVERFQHWCNGTTEYPLVNAIMNQLRQTGYISNRARQIAASALVNELNDDWRYGAAWFQHQLIDYEVGSNWGNWQYIAGVGFDPQGGRHFNLDKQVKQFDPDGVYQARWAPRTS